MGERIRFSKDVVEVQGYISLPRRSGPAVIVLHEWWGVDSPLSNIPEIVDNFAKAGFVAFAPDFYNGRTADNPDDAGKLMTDMFQNRMSEVEKMFSASVDFLKEHKKVKPKNVGVVGFCCGGTLSMYLPSIFPEKVSASVPFYGIPQLAPPKTENIKSPMFFILSEKDEFVNSDDVIDVAKKVAKNGVEVQIKVYPGVKHAFMNSKRKDVYDENSASDAWKMTIAFLKKHLMK